MKKVKNNNRYIINDLRIKNYINKSTIYVIYTVKNGATYKKLAKASSEQWKSRLQQH